MSTRVNLLPQASRDRRRAAQQQGVLGGVALAVLLVLIGLGWWQQSRVDEREDQLAEEQATLTSLQGELAELREFEDLAARAERADEVVAATLSDEVSVAAMLQDIAAVTPSNVWLENLAITIDTAQAAELGAGRRSVGRLTASGVATEGHAPGLERYLLELDKIAGFFNIYFSDSTLIEEDRFVDGDGDESTFSLELDLGRELRTERYEDGVPEELRPAVSEDAVPEDQS